MKIITLQQPWAVMDAFHIYAIWIWFALYLWVAFVAFPVVLIWLVLQEKKGGE